MSTSGRKPAMRKRLVGLGDKSLFDGYLKDLASELNLPAGQSDTVDLSGLNETELYLFNKVIQLRSSLNSLFVALGEEVSSATHRRPENLVANYVDGLIEQRDKAATQLAVNNAKRTQQVPAYCITGVFLAYLQLLAENSRKPGWKRVQTTAKQLLSLKNVPRTERDLLTQARVTGYLQGAGHLDDTREATKLFSVVEALLDRQLEKG